MPRTDEQTLTIALEAKIRDFERSMDRAQKKANGSFRKMERDASQSASRLEATFARAGQGIGRGVAGLGATFAAGFVSVEAVKQVVDYAAKYRDLQNALKVAGLEGKSLQDVFARLSQISLAQGAPLDALVTLYSRAAQSAGELGASQTELLQFSNGIATALRVAGTSATEAKGALLQLSQALGSGTVRAEEFNSVNEGARPILTAVANGMKEAGGSVSQLRALVLDGKVSSEAFFRAFLAGTGSLEEAASRAKGTVSQSLNRIDTAMTLLVGHLDDVTGASDNAATSLNGVAASIEAIPQYIDAAVAGLQNLQSWLTSVGNSPVWAKIGGMMGVDVNDPATLRAAGITPGAGLTSNTPDKRIANAFDVTAGTGVPAIEKGARPGAEKPKAELPKISIADYVPTSLKTPKAPKASGSGKAHKSGGAGGGSSRTESDYQRELASIKERTAALVAETAAQAGVNPLIDDYGRAADVARAKVDLLQAAQKAGVAITPEVDASISKLAESYGTATAAAGKLADTQDKARQSADDMRALGKDVLGGFIGDLRQGVSASQALSNALGKVVDKLIDVALNSVFDGLGKGGGFAGIFGAIGKILGFNAGGVVKAATGGHIRGPGTGTSDSIPARLSNGEFVVNARATKQNRAMLEAINSGRIPAFASGGMVAPRPISTPSFGSSGSRGGGDINITSSVTVQANGGTPEQNADLAKQTQKAVDAQVRTIVQQELRQQARPGGAFGR